MSPSPSTRPASRRRALTFGGATLLPLVLVGAAVLTVPSKTFTPLELASARAVSDVATVHCPGPVGTTSSAADQDTSDAEFQASGPTGAMSYRTIAIEPDSNLLYGQTTVSETTLTDEGEPIRPAIAITPDGGEKSDAPAAAGDGAYSTHGDNGVGTGITIDAESDGEGRPILDAIESSYTTSGDYRGLALTRCSEATTEATFVGMSTMPGDSSTIVLTNPSIRPARASLTVSTADGVLPATTASDVIVAPGATERVLVESLAPGEERAAVVANVEGSALEMHAETTEHEGLTPGGSEFVAPQSPQRESVIPGVRVTSGLQPTVTVFNPSGRTASADIRVFGPGGEVPAAAMTVEDIPAGGISTVTLAGVPEGFLSVQVTSSTAVAPTVRSYVQGADLPGDTVGAPRDFALHVPGEPIVNSSLVSLGLRGSGGTVSLFAERDTTATVVGIRASGEHTEPVDITLPGSQVTTLTSDTVSLPAPDIVGFLIVPADSGEVTGAWTQALDADGSGLVISAVPLANNNELATGLDVQVRP